MTNLIKSLSLLLVVCTFLPVDLLAQPAKRDRPISLDCVVCHVTWHDNINPEKSLLPELDAPIQIEGLPAHIPTLSMCITCHDGTVQDSRQVFSSSNHQSGMDVKKVNIKDLPLDKDGDIYCGTCHTPHSLKPLRKGGLAPFLRTDVKSSELCVQCHDQQSGSHRNHPIHIPVSPDHKMPAGTFFGEGNTIECMTCHPIHGEKGTFGVEDENRRELCSSCHESYFNIELTDHDLTTSLKNKAGQIGPSFGEQDACAACHSSHGGKGDNMWAMEIDRPENKNDYCLGCHNSEGLAREKSYAHDGHSVSGKKFRQDVPALGISSGDDLLCTTCHNPHQWEFSQRHAVGEANEEGTEYTSFLRLPDDAQGQLCTACHSDHAVITDSDHSVVREGFQQHFRSIGVFRGQCSACHETHGTGGYKLDEGATATDVSKELCESCHTDSHYPTTVGDFSHPMGNTLDAEINLPGYEGQITCITCHDPHVWGKITEPSLTVDLDGSDANSFLRVANWPEPNLCTSCHEEQAGVLNTDHDLSEGNHSACSFCHSSHNSEAKHGLLKVWDETRGDSYNEKFCFACHQENGSANKKVLEAWAHPHEYGTVTLNKRGTGEWIDFPLFGETQPQKDFGFIDCFTCHDPHSWSFNESLAHPGSKDAEGDYMTSFLRNRSGETLCSDCHGLGSLWKFNYYHDPVKRKRY